MKAEEFVQKLASLAPPEKTNQSEGTVNPGIERESYIAYRKSEVIELEDSKTDELIRLIKYFNLSSLEIGPVVFYYEIQEYKNFSIVGQSDLDFIAIDRLSGEVVILDHESDCTVVCSCAASGSNFLDSILECASYFLLCVNNKEIGNDELFAKQEARRFATIAGDTERYYLYYVIFLGCDY